MNNPFDIIKIIFTNPKEYENITEGEKRKVYFIINRRMAIQFPLQANALQGLKINQSAVVDFWYNFIKEKGYKKVPFWMFIKGIKKTEIKKEKEINISKELIRKYCKIYRIDEKSVQDALKLFPKNIIKELKKFEKLHISNERS